MSVRHTLQLCAAATALFLFFIVSSVVFATVEVGEAIKKGRSAETIVKEVFDLNALTDEYLAHPGERIIAQWTRTHDSIGRVLAGARADTEETQLLLDSLRSTHTDVDELFVQNTSPEEEGELPVLNVREAEQLKIKAQRMVSDATQLAALNYQAQEATREFADRILIGLVLLFACAAMGTMLLLYRRITYPLTALAEGTERIARGDLLHQLQVTSSDEFGEVANSFNEMARRLKTLYLDLDKRAWNAEETVEAQKEFIALLSHELRNPLAAAMSSMDLVEMQGADHPKTLKIVLGARQDMKTIARLLDDLLEISRVQQKTFTIQKETITVQTILKHTIASMKPLMKDRKLKFSAVIPKKPIRMPADPIRLSQIFSNVLSNAVKYTLVGGSIEVSCERDGSDVVIRVKDDGVGIGEDMLDQVFDMFVQGKTTSDHTAFGAGLGIGLSLTKMLTQMHDGTIEVQSDGEGLGSEFIIRLPLGESAKTPASAPQLVETESGVAAATLRIDDQPIG